MKDTGEIRVTITKQIDAIVKRVIDEGLFASKSELAKTALIEYLDKMHLLDQIKNSIESKPID